MKKFLGNLGLLTLLMFFIACTGNEPIPTSSEQNTTVVEGVVESVRKIETRNSGVGTMIGGALGSVAGSVVGSRVGSGTGQVLSSVLGSVIGSIAGGTAGNNMSKNYSQEVMVKLNNGETPRTVLKIDNVTPELTTGQEVNVFFNEGKIFKIIAR